MDHQPQQRFCTSCGQPLAPGAAFCVACGTQASAPSMGAPGPFSASAQPGYPPPYAQAPTPAQDDPLPAFLASGYLANRMGRPPLLRARQRPRRPGSRLRGRGCLLLILAALAGPFIGVALTSGRPHLIFMYVAGGMVILFFLVVLMGMLATRRGREALSEGCLEAILGGLLGGG
jgi:zinc-ribbon domain